VVFGWSDDSLKLLLIRRGAEPFAGKWALPGGFVQMDEELDTAAKRELQEETGLESVYLEQLYTFGTPDRDPRGRVVSVAYYALVRDTDHVPHADTDAAEAQWFGLDQIPALAFDHAAIVETAIERLRGKIRYQPIGFDLLPDKFTLPQLKTLYDTLLGEFLDRRNFRKKFLSMGLLEELPETQEDVPHRAARLYRFDREKYLILEKEGFQFRV
jgi:8-oxo-dGTP diphosphatase